MILSNVTVIMTVMAIDSVNSMCMRGEGRGRRGRGIEREVNAW